MKALAKAKPNTRRVKGLPAVATSLADVTITRTVGNTVQRVTGAELARLLNATEGRLYGGTGPTFREELTSPSAIALDLQKLGGLAGVLADGAEDEESMALALQLLRDELEKMAHRLSAVDPCENHKPHWYQVQATRRAS